MGKDVRHLQYKCAQQSKKQTLDRGIFFYLHQSAIEMKHIRE